jgi:Sodium / potassium ATPase beta chain
MSKGKGAMEAEEPFYVRRKPDPVPFSKFLYNSDKGTVMGRTGSSWGKLVATKCPLESLPRLSGQLVKTLSAKKNS